MEIKQEEEYEGDDWWTWSVWLDGVDPAAVKQVIWKLHPTFPKPSRVVTDASTKFQLKSSGWGTFIVKADVLMKDGTQKKLEHELELHYPDGKVATA
jgi:transcription initiation factor IIF auxiliary subunit